MSHWVESKWFQNYVRPVIMFPNYHVSSFYHRLGLLERLESDRYMSLRPGDAFILHFSITGFVSIGIPLLILVYMFQWISISGISFFIGVAILLILPIIVTYGFCEYEIWRFKQKPPPQ
jgi:hypothetical protein